jgi:endonuclease/exonuclease/phosphatase (EEP) superfamily protein YafD
VTGLPRRLVSLAGAGLLGVSLFGSIVVGLVGFTRLQERSARFMGLAGMSATVAWCCLICALVGALLVVLGGAWRWIAWCALVPCVLGVQLNLATASGLVRPEHVTEGEPLSLVAQNLWYRNQDLDRAARELLALDADVLVLSEYTATARAAFQRAGSDDRYPHRWEVPRSSGRGLAVLSTLPLVSPTDLGLSGPGLRTEVQLSGGPDGTRVELFAVHVNAPTSIYDLPRWVTDMDRLTEQVASAGPRTVVAGDFNATAGHIRFRRLVRAGDLRDAHDAAGGGFVATWPIGRRWTPQLLRIDHVLVGPGLGIESFRLLGDVGSDHRGVEAWLRVPTGGD